jgi:iron complex transport system substrate-binding protein
LLAAILLAASFPGSAQIMLRDDAGRSIYLKSPAKRIVTLAPFLTELAFAAGVGDRVVGVGPNSDYPPRLKRLPEVPVGANFSIEHVAVLRPDLILARRDSMRREDIERVSSFGAPVFIADVRRLEDISRLLQVIGTLTGSEVGAMAADFDSRIEALRRANAKKPRLATFVEIWNRPLTTVSGSHFITEALDICHAENVFRDVEGFAPVISWEDLQARNPYVVVGAGSASDLAEFRSNWSVRQALAAVKDDRLIFMESDSIDRPTLRIVNAIAKLCTEMDGIRARNSASLPPEPRRSQYGM